MGSAGNGIEVQSKWLTPMQLVACECAIFHKRIYANVLLIIYVCMCVLRRSVAYCHIVLYYNDVAMWKVYDCGMCSPSVTLTVNCIY